MKDDKRDDFKNISNDYKDYKYTYTGYENYLKNKTDKKENEKELEEEIDHDHDYQFDFNNPNEHKHDYNFDFPSEKPKRDEQKVEKSSTTNSYSSLNKNNFNNAKKVIITIVFVYVLFFIISIITIMFNSFKDSYLENDTNELYSDYYDPVYAYCTAIIDEDYNLIESFVPHENLRTLWETNLSNTHDDEYMTTCGDMRTTILDDEEIETLNEQYQEDTDDDRNITNAYLFEIDKVLDYTPNGEKINIIVAEIDDDWYLLDQR